MKAKLLLLAVHFSPFNNSAYSDSVVPEYLAIPKP